MPENTLKYFAAHAGLGTIMRADGGDCEDVLAQLQQESAWMSKLCPLNLRTTESNLSSSPGTNGCQSFQLVTSTVAQILFVAHQQLRAC